MSIHLSEITNEILRVHCSTQEHLASTFLRFQEHYESPEFRGKIFTLEEYKEYYTKKHGEFSYYKDWSGFNVPSYVFEPFRQGKFDPLSTKESRLLSLLRAYKGKFYVIGTYERKDEKQKEEITLQHETAHGLFYTVPEYKEEILAILSKVDLGPIRKYVKDFENILMMY